MEYKILQELQDMKKQLAILTSCMIAQARPPASDMLLQDYLRLWYRDFRVCKIAPATLRKDYNNIENKLIPALGHWRLSDLNSLLLQVYFNTITAPRQCEHLYVLLKHSLRVAVEQKLLQENPMMAVVIPKYESNERLPFSPADELKFFSFACKSKYADIYTILRYEGLRPGELLALDGERIKSESVLICSAKDTLGNFKQPKTKAGRREIPIFNEARSTLAKYAGKTGLLFPVSLYTLEEDFRNIKKASGICSDYVLYCLRHTFITRCAESNVHPKVVQKWVGHKTINMTLKYYTHISQEWEIQEKAKLMRYSFEEK